MLDTKRLLMASLDAGLQALKPPRRANRPARAHTPAVPEHAAQTDDASAQPTPLDAALPDSALPHIAVPLQDASKSQWLVPMRALGPAHRERMARHLLQLTAHDRYLRFGYPATDEHISRYVADLNFARDEIFGIYNRRLQLIAVAHLAFSNDPKCQSCAEFGVSVLPQARGRGYGSRLFERALNHARNEGVQMLFIQALTENAPMLAIARKHGATLVQHGSETEAHLRLAPADWESRLEEFVEDQVADVDFELKLQAKQFWAALGSLQGLRNSLPPQS